MEANRHVNSTDHTSPENNNQEKRGISHDGQSLVPENHPREREVLRQIRMKLRSGFYGSRAILETIAERMMGR
jgi:hypothetical protein